MNRLKALIVTMFLVAGCSSQPAQDTQKKAADVTYFTNAHVITGDGSAPRENATVAVEDGIIKQIGTKDEMKIPNGAGVVDLQGHTLMPVLINTHAHLGLVDNNAFAAGNYSHQSVSADLNRYEYYGVGAVLSLGTDSGDTIFQIRDEQQQGKAEGAKVLTAGRGITAKGGFPITVEPGLKDIVYQAADEAEARKDVDEMADKKVDVIKIWVDDGMGKAPKLKPEMYRAIIDEAHKKNLRVFAHVFALADAKDLVKSGIDGLAHSIRDKEVDDEFVSMMKEKKIPYVPTLTAHQAAFVYLDSPKWLGEQSMREVYSARLTSEMGSPDFLAKLKANPDLAKLRQQYAVAQKNLKKLADGGAVIGFGTDSGTPNSLPGYFEHRELELMVEAGLSPLQAIQAATSTSADILHLKDLGTLAAGKSADFVILGMDPLKDIHTTRDIQSIYRHGKEIDRSGLITQISAELIK